MKILTSFFSWAHLTLVAALLLALCCCARGSRFPSELAHIPQDLENEKLDVEGIYRDGWIAEEASCSLEQPGEARFLTIRGTVPTIAGDPDFRTDLDLSIDGQKVGHQQIRPGEFEFSAPVMPGSGRRRIAMTFTEVQTLPAGDGRQVGARLEFIGFAETSAVSDIVYSPKLQLGDGWGLLETFRNERFRWVENDAEILVEASNPSPVALSLLVEPGSGVGAKSFELKLLDATGNVVGKQRVDGRRMLYFTLPANLGPQNRFRLHIDGGGKRSATDPRILNFRIFKIELG